MPMPCLHPVMILISTEVMAGFATSANVRGHTSRSCKSPNSLWLVPSQCVANDSELQSSSVLMCPYLIGLEGSCVGICVCVCLSTGIVLGSKDWKSPAPAGNQFNMDDA